MTRSSRLLIAASIGITVGTALAGILAAENAFHIWERLRPNASAADDIAQRTGARWEDVQVRAADGAVLDGWLFTPARANGSAAILLHGVADTRRGMREHAAFLVENGYTVLTPDVRGHGSSGGDIITYGVREAGDVGAWAAWLLQSQPVTRIYGFGESMGAAILIQAARGDPRLRAIVAECAFANFESIAFERFTQVSHLPVAALWPIIHAGFLYERVRYGVDLRQASPVDALRESKVPVLLIHGARDTNIPIHHSRELYAANRATVQLWEVPGAGHVEALFIARELYIRTVVEWFRSHP